MDKSKQFSVRLKPPGHEFLQREAARLGITIADLVRRIIDQHKDSKQ